MRRVLIAVSTLSILASVVAAPPASAAFADVAIDLTSIGTFSEPIALTSRPGVDGTLYIAEQTGRIRAVPEVGSPFVVLDIHKAVSDGGEQGLLGMAFSPDGSRLYINFTNRLGDTVVLEYKMRANGTANKLSARRLLKIRQPYDNHNGGNLAFSPNDGYLYIGMGDGGSANDPENRAQNLNTRLGKMLRIDPTNPPGPRPFKIPADNPFVGEEGADIIWAYGLRNPWRWSFDRDTGDLWIGDVGQSAWEEIDFQAASSDGGENYGWVNMEGDHVHQGTEPANHTPPVFEYSQGGGNCAVTGGYVYRGDAITDLDGAYVYGDYCKGELRAFLPSDPASSDRSLNEDIGDFVLSSFGEDEDGELYVLSLDGTVYRIEAD